ncbi:heme biosynthesis HemY N-terminal domain-containing protein [Alloalcanivorax xenomutans]|uniref:heme biosynthesis HemY N-terminal domain-containing protein n=1 Tax=Alloalcanivorax xenomutans TaxID=1094342 RepID=UPI0003B893ED|nr:heme biosynthesis HemY N-terminal domain-containing protein [Alloalcanivorax xenomutans]ERS13838.1 heme biosynthesis protein HemY [Alcanivorax sp. PN-3]MBA4722077.1 heme biosynthesis protein HemY [Alcanivorax sp.]SOC23413.1 HemY protein [Alloalcanivorax xenomutans]
MKKILLLLVLALIAAAALGRWMAADSGYLLLVRGNWEMDTTLGFAVLVMVLAAVALVVATLILNGLWQLAEPVRATRRFRQSVARRRLKSGLVLLVDGDIKKAERLLSAAGREGDWPLAAWLLAAECARERGDGEALEQYLGEASADRRGLLMSGLMRARFALDDGQPEQARHELEALLKQAPNNRRVLTLYADVLDRLHDWPALCDLIPRLRKVLDEQSVARRERRAWLARVQEVAQKPGFNDAESRAAELRRLWKSVPVALKNDPAMKARYAGFLAQLGQGKVALGLVREQLGKEWDDRLPPVLEAIDDVPPDDLLQVLEGWLAERPGNAAVLITAGRVALKARLWGKAQSFFEAAANSSQSATALAELARLYRALGDHGKADQALERRVSRLDSELPSLPMPN